MQFLTNLLLQIEREPRSADVGRTTRRRGFFVRPRWCSCASDRPGPRHPSSAISPSRLCQAPPVSEVVSQPFQLFLSLFFAISFTFACVHHGSCSSRFCASRRHSYHGVHPTRRGRRGGWASPVGRRAPACAACVWARQPAGARWRSCWAVGAVAAADDGGQDEPRPGRGPGCRLFASAKADQAWCV